MTHTLANIRKLATLWPIAPLLLGQSEPHQPVANRARRRFLKLKRLAFRDLTFARLLRGGRPTDSGRLGRYAIVTATGLAIAWLPAIAYLKLAAPSYTSHFSVILPGAGASSSVSLSDIGQSSSSASSAYSNASISPTVTYKNLIMSANVINAAALELGVAPENLPTPTIKLINETSFIRVEMPGASSAIARDRSNAILSAFYSELTKLREDEVMRREGSTTKVVEDYEGTVKQIRTRISRLQIASGLNSVEQYNGYVTAAEQLETQLSETENQLAKAREATETLAANLNISPEIAATTMKLHADPQYAALADAASKAQAAFAETDQQYGPKHPKVIDAKGKFLGAQKEMMARASKITDIPVKKLTGKIDLSPVGQRPALMSQLIALETEKQGLTAQLVSMKENLTESRTKVRTLVQVAADLDALGRDYKVAEAVFASALARINTSKADIFASYPMVQVAEAPIMPISPSSPSPKVAIGAAGGSTLLLLFASVLGWLRRPLIDRLLKKTHDGA